MERYDSRLRSIQYNVARSIERGILTPTEATNQLLEALKYTTGLMQDTPRQTKPRLQFVENPEVTMSRNSSTQENHNMLVPEILNNHPIYGFLSPREKEVFWLRILGKSTREIAETLVITTQTVQTHTTKISEVLGVHTRNFVRHAYDNGINPTIISPEN